jgi:hypothetical protein
MQIGLQYFVNQIQFRAGGAAFHCAPMITWDSATGSGSLFLREGSHPTSEKLHDSARVAGGFAPI